MTTRDGWHTAEDEPELTRYRLLIGGRPIYGCTAVHPERREIEVDARTGWIAFRLQVDPASFAFEPPSPHVAEHSAPIWWGGTRWVNEDGSPVPDLAAPVILSSWERT